MIKARLKLNGAYYVGEHPDITIKVESKGMTNWHNYQGKEVNELLFSQDPKEAKELYGMSGIKSELNKILDRVCDDLLILQKLEIERMP